MVSNHSYLLLNINNEKCSDHVAKMLSKTSLGSQLHQTIQEQLRNSFPEINQLAFDILIHLQRLNNINNIPFSDNLCLLDPEGVHNNTKTSYVAKIIDDLRYSCSIATSNGLSLELLYAIHLESATKMIHCWKKHEFQGVHREIHGLETCKKNHEL